MKRQFFMFLLAIVMLTTISATDVYLVSGFSGQNAPVLSRVDTFANPSPSRVETLSLRTPRETSQEVQVYLPRGYDSSNDTYPVLYLSDGGAYIGRVGDVPFIIVGIDYSWDERWNKYSPWVNTEMDKWFGLSPTLGGEGDEYLSYLVGLKTNHIDQKYRTKPEPQHTAIGGHSMGGLFAIYAGIKRNDIFTKVIAFSPAVWFGSRDINNWLSNNHFMEYISNNNPVHVNYFLYVGGKEDHQHEAPGYPLVGKFPEIYEQGVRAVHKILGGDFIFDPNGTHFITDFVSWFDAAVVWLEAVGFGFNTPDPVEPTPGGPTPVNPTQVPGEPTSTPEPLIQPIIKSTPKPDGSVVHVVQYGQSLWQISEFYEIPLTDLLEQNNLTEESTVFLNQELIIVPASTDVVETGEAATPEEEPVHTKTLAPTPTRTISPTLTKTPFPTPTNVAPTPYEETETSGISGLSFFGGRGPLWIGVGLIATSLFVFAVFFNPFSRKDK